MTGVESREEGESATACLWNLHSKIGVSRCGVNHGSTAPLPIE